MNCVACKDGHVETMLVEHYPCKCGDTISIEYLACFECGALWRALDGEYVKDSLMLPDTLEDENGFQVSESPTTMGGLIHKCVKCNSVCYEVGFDMYKCSLCGFEWEVIDGELL
jgi:hypothetical protein